MSDIQKISFSYGNFDAIICINGKLPEAELIKKFEGSTIVCADGAANKLIEYDIPINFIVGDLDSIDVDLVKSKYGEDSIIHDPDQDTNDFEKCLQFCQSHEWNKLLVLGIHGHLLEHTINNWSVLKRFSKVLDIVIYDDGRYAFTISKDCSILVEPDEILSLIPQTQCELSTQGMQWELDKELLTIGSKEGARNRATQKVVHIQIHSGQILFFCNARIPKAINRA